MPSNERKGAGAKKPVETGKFDRFNLDQRPVRPPGHNAYFDDIRSQLALQQSGLAAGQIPGDEKEGATSANMAVASNPSDDSSDEAGAVVEPAELLTTKELNITSLPAEQDPKKGPHRLSLATDSPGQGKKSKPALSPLSQPASVGFAEFKKEWELLLKKNLMKVCEVLHRHTIAVGLTEYSTTTEDLCKEVGVSSRHLLHLLAQLEKLGFVSRRDDKTGNNRTVGKIISFHPNRVR